MRLVTSFALLAALGGSAFAVQPVVPRPAKELEIVAPGRKPILLTSLRGKVVVIQFLFTTCPHCQAYSQVLTKVQNDYGSKIQCLGGAFNEEANPATVAAYINQFKVGFPIGPVARDTVFSFMGFSLLDRIVVPQIVLIDKKGQIREQTEGNPKEAMPLQNDAHLRSMIDKLLAEGAPAPAKAAPATGSNNKDVPKNPHPNI